MSYLDWDWEPYKPTEEEMMEEMFRDTQLDNIYRFIDTLRKYDKEEDETVLGECDICDQHRRSIDTNIDFTLIPVQDRNFVILEYIYLCKSLHGSDFEPPVFLKNSSFWIILETFLKLSHKYKEGYCTSYLETILAANPHMKKRFRLLRFRLKHC